jgi:peptidoglycan/xylan/chitin deacetylase (PgdA/CDA1 family)
VARIAGHLKMGIHRRTWHTGAALRTGLVALIALGLSACNPTMSAGPARTSAPATGAPTSASGPADPGPGPGVSPTPPPLPPAIAAQLPSFDPPPIPDPVAPPSPGPSAEWFSAIPTKERVAFLTIDDGFTKDPEFIDVLRASHIHVTLFLEINAIKNDPGYFAKLVDAGALIEAHTISHPNLVGLPYATQVHEICGSADRLTELYGRRPVLFRPPYGNKDATTLRAVHDCGMKAAFFWKETINGGKLQYQVGSKVRPGDIILMHFRPNVVGDFLAGLQAIKDAGLTPALLEDYIGGNPPPLMHPPPRTTATPTPTPVPPPIPPATPDPTDTPTPPPDDAVRPS